MTYNPDELLLLSGIQHFMFCRRQWALIHVEKLWKEDARTLEGAQLHQKTDDPFERETKHGMIISRALPVISYEIGLQGICDVVEFMPDPAGVQLVGHKGSFLAAPVEYKHGKVKESLADQLQLCAQAMCLEEMLSVNIPLGYLFYWSSRQRIAVDLEQSLRTKVIDLSKEMHQYFARGYTPKVRKEKFCRSCSMIDLCCPDMQSRSRRVDEYISKILAEDK